MTGRDALATDGALEDGFYDILTELCHRFQHVHRAKRVQALLIAALAMIDAQSIEDRKGVAATEDEFIRFCRMVFRKARGTAGAARSG